MYADYQFIDFSFKFIKVNKELIISTWGGRSGASMLLGNIINFNPLFTVTGNIRRKVCTGRLATALKLI